MKKQRPVPLFQHHMKRLPTVLGWCYVPVHMVALPLLLAMYVEYAVPAPDEMLVNGIFYGAGVLFVTICMGPFLRQQYDVMLDNKLRSLLAFSSAFVVEYALSLLAALGLLAMENTLVNPNNEAVMALSEMNYGAVKGLAIFIAPIVEEVLFRGVVFGSLRSKNRRLAYVVSIALFALYHVWQYALTDPTLLLYAIQYIPAAFALAWAYEHSNSIWIPIFFHMLSNGVSFAVLSML